MAAEVINMERSIVITGDSDRFAAGKIQIIILLSELAYLFLGFGWHGGAIYLYNKKASIFDFSLQLLCALACYQRL